MKRNQRRLEFAFGIRWEANQAQAEIADENVSATTRSCEALATSGLPSHMGSRTLLTTDFSGWQPASFNEFVCANGAQPLPRESHQTWQFMHERRRYVVPALVLMRAIFSPNKLLLRYLYRIQSLEELCEFSGHGEESPIASLTSLGTSYFRRDRRQIARLLSWMFCFPSARQMWASVYHHGRDGRIGLQLPAAQVSLLLKGLKHASNVYVTGIHVDSVTALEEPFEFAPRHLRTTSYLVESWVGRTNTRRPQQTIALRGRQAKLSNHEWDAIKPILDETQPYQRVTSAPPRAMVDGVLEKLCHGAPWKDTKYPAGVTHGAASSALHRWRLDGRWTRIEEVLRQSRGKPAESPS